MLPRRDPGSGIFVTSATDVSTEGSILNMLYGSLRGGIREVIYLRHPVRIPPRRYPGSYRFWTSVTDDSAETSRAMYILDIRNGCLRGGIRQVIYFGRPLQMFPRTRPGSVYFRYPAWRPPQRYPASYIFWTSARDASAEGSVL